MGILDQPLEIDHSMKHSTEKLPKSPLSGASKVDPKLQLPKPEQMDISIPESVVREVSVLCHLTGNLLDIYNTQAEFDQELEDEITRTIQGYCSIHEQQSGATKLKQNYDYLQPLTNKGGFTDAKLPNYKMFSLQNKSDVEVTATAISTTQSCERYV